MNKIIQILEQMGQDAALQTTQAANDLVIKSDLSEELQASLTELDSETLAKQLDTANNIFCGILPAEDDEPSEDDESEDTDTETNAVING